MSVPSATELEAIVSAVVPLAPKVAVTSPVKVWPERMIVPDAFGNAIVLSVVGSSTVKNVSEAFAVAPSSSAIPSYPPPTLNAYCSDPVAVMLSTLTPKYTSPESELLLVLAAMLIALNTWSVASTPKTGVRAIPFAGLSVPAGV